MLMHGYRCACPECRQARTDRDWQRRLRDHDRDAPYPCAYCPLTFATPRARGKHECAEERRIVRAR